MYTNWTAIGMGSLMSVKSTMRKTAAASESLFALLDSKTAVAATGTESKLVLSGDIVFENVDFHYTSRPDVSFAEWSQVLLNELGCGDALATLAPLSI